MSDESINAILDEKAPATWSDSVPAVSPETLIESGFHFGHRAARWNPKMKPFIKDKRNGIHIINLKESLRGVITARHFLRNLTSTGAKVLFVGTKRQAKDIIRNQAQRAGQAFMCERWLGGTLTNFATIRRRLSRLEILEKLHTSGKLAAMPKKMQSVLNREKGKIENNLDGLRNLDRLPAAMVVVDAGQEEIAILEANKLEIPIIAIVDTNSSPDLIDIVIPGNDDSVRGLQIVLKSLADSCIEGRKLHESGQGMQSKLDIRAFDDAPAAKKPERGQRRPQRDRGGRTRHARTAEQKAAVDQSAEEAAKQAEAQSKEAPPPTVRRKPPAKKPDAKPEAPKAEAAPAPKADS
ncbi:MAG: 30S ribosomal protein S2 [Planctomycetes bacterium]|nr:30S ribosomal protein S2 [Planctomycetota bacterium]